MVAWVRVHIDLDGRAPGRRRALLVDRRRGRACETEGVNSLLDDDQLGAVLDRLHAASDAQAPDIDAYYAAGAGRPSGYESEDSAGRAFWRDKFVALDRDKAEFVYLLCRANGARRVIEAGTSFGVSTLYLAAAVRDNGGGLVTTCDIEDAKAAVATRNFAEARLSDQVDLRVGDIRETLRQLNEAIDVLLLDIWAPIAGDVVALVGPHLRVGGVVVADNTTVRRELYGGLFDYLDDPANGFTTRTLPFGGGLELAVKTTR
jgi:predicted O-methyltransferase YrrM